MLKLTAFNFFLIAIIAALLLLVKKHVKADKLQNRLLLASALVTILFHYSSFIFYLLTGGEAIEYLKQTPNLILPIYPCNVVMWSCLILPFIKNEESKLKRLLIDYVFWFGIFSTLVGMFANVDFIMNPTLKDYEITKSIVAHATLLFNVLLLAVFGKVRISFSENLKNMLLSVAIMYVVGLYCNLVFEVLVSADAAYDVNSMFIIHSPFESAAFLKYPVIAVVALFLYFILFTVCDLIKNERGARFFDKVILKLKRTSGKS